MPGNAGKAENIIITLVNDRHLPRGMLGRPVLTEADDATSWGSPGDFLAVGATSNETDIIGSGILLPII